MNGIHDLGGMDGFARIVREDNEPVFHSEWEARVSKEVQDLTGAVTKMQKAMAQSIAQYGQRIITFKDGRIVSDQPVRDRRNADWELHEEAVAS